MTLYYSVNWNWARWVSFIRHCCCFHATLSSITRILFFPSPCPFIKTRTRNLGKVFLGLFACIFTWITNVAHRPLHRFCERGWESNVKSKWTTMTKQVANKKSTRPTEKCVYSQPTMQINFLPYFFLMVKNAKPIFFIYLFRKSFGMVFVFSRIALHQSGKYYHSVNSNCWQETNREIWSHDIAMSGDRHRDCV